MKILLLGDFRQHHPRFMVNKERMFSKGFLRNGHDVLQFSYRDTLLGQSPFRSKKLAVRLAKKKTDTLLCSLARHYQPNIIMIMTFKLLDANTITRLKDVAPHAITMCWYSDMYAGIDPKVAPIARLCDWFLASSAGSTLQSYKDLGIKQCAFIPVPGDKDIEHPRIVPVQWRSSILFTGKLEHSQAGQDPMRSDLIKDLVKRKGMTVYGCLGQPVVEGLDYLNAVCGTKIGLSINAFNDVPLYHSNRLMHNMGCGTFVLCKYVPQSEQLFTDQEHLCYFETKEQCLELIDRFLGDDSLRDKIARQGMQHVHANFSCEKLAAYIIDLAHKETYDPPWGRIV